MLYGYKLADPALMRIRLNIVMWPWGLWLTAAPGRIGTVAMTPIYQSLGTKEEKRA